MPHRRPQAPPAKPPSKPRPGFRKHYDQLEIQRAVLVARLGALGEAGQRHDGHKRALKLLNDTFRKAKLAQRLAILQAAAWLIDVLERLNSIT